MTDLTLHTSDYTSESQRRQAAIAAIAERLEREADQLMALGEARAAWMVLKGRDQLRRTAE